MQQATNERHDSQPISAKHHKRFATEQSQQLVHAKNLTVNLILTIIPGGAATIMCENVAIPLTVLLVEPSLDTADCEGKVQDMTLSALSKHSRIGHSRLLTFSQEIQFK